ncbi:unnamed protein product, partial [Allacma fusca]
VSSRVSQLWGWLKSIFNLDMDMIDLGAFGDAEMAVANPILDPGEDVFLDALENPAWAVGNDDIPVSRMKPRKG